MFKSTKTKRVSQTHIYFVTSNKSKEKYVLLMIDGNPYKFWNCKDLGVAGVDLITTLMTMYDKGYNINYQFPKKTSEGRCIVSEKVDLTWEPCYPEKKHSAEDIKMFFNENPQHIFDGVDIDSLNIQPVEMVDQTEFIENYLDFIHNNKK